jgi:phage FluMu gp28-like protein
MITVPADIDVRDDIAMIEVRDGIPKMRKERGTDSKDKKPRHGDSAIALALAFARHASAPVDFSFRRVPKWEDNPQRDGARERPRPARRHIL